MKFYYLYLFFATIFAINVINSAETINNPLIATIDDDIDLKSLEISDDDLSALESMGLSKAQAKEFSTAILNLPEEEKQALAKLSQQLEEDMRSQGLDPQNPEDYFKWFDKNADKEEKVAQEEPKIAKEEVKPKEEVKVEEIIIPASTTVDTNTLLENLIQNLGEIKVKAYATEYTNNKIERWESELRELIYFLYILMDKELLKHLTSKDFTVLLQNLENLDKALSSLAPQVKGEIITEETNNPYELLNISNNANKDEIDTAYQNLKKFYSQESIETKLKERNFSEKEIKKQIKSAKINFRFIDDAYESLKDPKQKTIIDKKLKDQIQQDTKLRALSNKAFDKILDIFSSSIYNILKDIHKLMEKYKPEELAKAKQQEELEKTILAKSKQPQRITPSKPGPFKFTTEKPYEAFWKELEREDAKRKYATKTNAPEGKEKPEKIKNALWEPTKKKEFPDKDKKKEDKKDDKDKKDKDKDDKSKDKKTDKKDGKDSKSKKLETSILVSNIADILEKATDEIEEIEKPKKTGPIDTEQPEPAEEPEKPKKIKLKDLAKQVNTYVTNRTIDPLDKTIIKNLGKFVQENKIEDLWEKITKVNPGPQGKLEPAVIKIWNEKDVNKYGKKIDEWNKLLAKEALAPNADRQAKNLSPEKNRFHSIDAAFLKDIKDYKKKLKHIDEKIKDKPEYQDLEVMNLGVLRKYITDIKEAFDNIKKLSQAPAQ